MSTIGWYPALPARTNDYNRKVEETVAPLSLITDDSPSGTAMDDASSNQDDGEIVRQAVAGNVNAFEHLLKKYQYFVLAIVKKHVPSDQIEHTVQDVFVRTYRSLPTFKGNSFGHWLSVIAIRTCYDFWREHYKSRELPMSLLTEEHLVWLNAALFDNSNQSFREAGLQKEAREILDLGLGETIGREQDGAGLVDPEVFR